MKHLFFLLLLFTNIARSQEPSWKINGTLAALTDSSKAFNARVIYDLFHLHVLDTLIYSGAISKSVIDQIKNEDGKSLDEYSFYVLLSQKDISQQDFDWMRKMISVQALQDGTEPFAVFYTLLIKTNVPSKFIDLFRGPWDSLSINYRTTLMDLMLRQEEISVIDFDLIQQLLTLNCPGYLKTYAPALRKRAIANESEKSFRESQELTVHSLCADYPKSKQVRAFFDSCVRTNTFDNNKRLYALLVDSTEFGLESYPAEMFPIFKELAEKLRIKHNSAYFKAIANFKSIPEVDLKEIVAHCGTYDCLTREIILEKLVFKKALQPVITNIILNGTQTKNCSSWLHFINYLNDSLRYSPEVIRRIGNPDSDLDVSQYDLLYYFARKPILSNVELNFIEKTIASVNGAYRDELIRRLHLQRLNPEVMNLLRTYLRNNNSQTDLLITNLLLQQKECTSPDASYFKRLLNDPLVNDKESIITGLANQEILQSEIQDILKNILDTSTTFSGVTELTLAKRASIPDIFWPYISTHIMAAKSPFIALDDLIVQMPEKYCLSMADSLCQSYFNETSEGKRYTLYFLGGGSSTINHLMKWVYPTGADLPALDKLNDDAKEKSLEYFDIVWDSIQHYIGLKECISRQVIRVSQRMSPSQIKQNSALLQRMVKRFGEDIKLESQYAELRLKLERVNGIEKRFTDFIASWWYILFFHPLFWALMIFIYPKNRKVQSLFFWNSNVRKWLGLGYVNLLLIHVPFLRNRLLFPFKGKMLADARMEEFKAENYFTDFTLINARTKDKVTIDNLKVLPGQIIIRGDSGLGKTMILRKLLSKSKKQSVFILAEKCQKGVEVAIESKIFGISNVTGFDGFIKSILYNGYLDVYLDGINEVGQPTFGKINDFIAQYEYCHGYFTTQPTAWDIPSQAITIDILPLEQRSLSSFLYNVYPIRSIENIIGFEDFQKKCDHFLNDHIGNGVPVEQKILNQKILSNPYDLTIVGQLIIDWPQEKMNLLSLQKVYFELMAKKYSEDYNLKEKFPLQKFSETVFEQRYYSDISKLPYDEFHDEIDCMHSFKMAINRVSEQGEEEWYFRHDKIRDFFILQAFITKNERQKMLVDDPRFRGVYFLMATLLPIEDAKYLERILIDFAADNNDHSVSDDFIRLLRARQQADHGRKDQNPGQEDQNNTAP